MWTQESVEWPRTPQQSCQAQLPPCDPAREEGRGVNHFHTVTWSQLQRFPGCELPAPGQTGAWQRAISARTAKYTV